MAVNVGILEDDDSCTIDKLFTHPQKMMTCRFLPCLFYTLKSLTISVQY